MCQWYNCSFSAITTFSIFSTIGSYLPIQWAIHYRFLKIPFIHVIVFLNYISMTKYTLSKPTVWLTGCVNISPPHTSCLFVLLNSCLKPLNWTSFHFTIWAPYRKYTWYKSLVKILFFNDRKDRYLKLFSDIHIHIHINFFISFFFYNTIIF